MNQLDLRMSSRPAVPPPSSSSCEYALDLEERTPTERVASRPILVDLGLAGELEARALLVVVADVDVGLCPVIPVEDLFVDPARNLQADFPVALAGRRGLKLRDALLDIGAAIAVADTLPPSTKPTAPRMVTHPADFPTPPNIRNSYKVRPNLAFDRRNCYATTPLSPVPPHTRRWQGLATPSITKWHGCVNPKYEYDGS